MTGNPHNSNKFNEPAPSEGLSAAESKPAESNVPEFKPPRLNSPEPSADRLDTAGTKASPAETSGREAPKTGIDVRGTDPADAGIRGMDAEKAGTETTTIETSQETDGAPSVSQQPEHMEPAADTNPATSTWQGGYLPSEWQRQPTAIQPDLDVPWGAKEIALLLLFVAIFIEVAALGISLSLRSLGITHAFVPKDPRETSIFLLVNQAVLFAGVLGYLYLRIHYRYRAPFWRTLQWKPLRPIHMPGWTAYLSCIGGGCAMALVIEAASQHLGKSVSMPIETFFKTRDTALVLMVMSVALAPLLEETIFRGFLYPVLARAWGVAWGVALTGILFGLMHSYQLGGSKSHIALLILVGITLTWVRAGTRSVLASFLMHISYNGFLTAGFIVSGALRHLPPR